MSVQKISESVCAGMCQEIGIPLQVDSRRERMNEGEWLMNKITKWITRKHIQLEIMVRGSQKLQGSDVDVMYWPADYRVIWDISQSRVYNVKRKTLILCDSFESQLDSFYFCYHSNMLNYYRLVYRGEEDFIFQVLNAKP